MSKLVVYLTFSGTCREAMTFYQQCLGGELQLVPFPAETAASDPPAAVGRGIMHARLVNGPLVLLAFDNPHEPVVNGNAIILSLACTSPTEAESLFSALGRGGTITMPLADQPWGAYFGMLTDQFGIQWMVDYDYPPAA